MPEQPGPALNDRFKAEMPQIPGVSTPPSKPAGSGGPWLVMIGLVAVLIAVFVDGRLLSKPKRTEAPPPTPQIDVPVPAPDLTATSPLATQQSQAVATASDLKPW